MKIRGAVLEATGCSRPYSDSAPISITALELDDPGPDEVLIEIEAAGICHSDLSVVDGNRPRPLPMLLGHEAAGRVRGVGARVNNVKVGDRVVTTFLPRCGQCAGCKTNGLRPCSAGSTANTAGVLLSGERRLSRDGAFVNHHLGVSGFATHAVVDSRSLVRLHSDIPPDVAALLGCAVLTGGGAVLNAAPPQKGDRLAVVGLGAVGMAAVLTALALDDVEVIAVDALESKRSAALAMGAARAISPTECGDLKADVVIEAAGNVRALETAIAITAAGGSTVTVGLPAPDARTSFSPASLVGEGRRIIGSYLGSAVPERDIPVFAQMWRAGRLPIEQLITSKIQLDDINEGMDRLADGAALRQIIEFS